MLRSEEPLSRPRPTISEPKKRSVGLGLEINLINASEKSGGSGENNVGSCRERQEEAQEASEKSERKSEEKVRVSFTFDELQRERRRRRQKTKRISSHFVYFAAFCIYLFICLCVHSPRNVFASGSANFSSRVPMAKTGASGRRKKKSSKKPLENGETEGRSRRQIKRDVCTCDRIRQLEI